MIDVLVPILGRSPVDMLQSLEKGTSVPYSVFLLCSPGDDETIEICRATGHTTWVMEWASDRGDFAKKINWGFEHTEQPWIFQGADDIRFSPGWDAEALRIADAMQVGVVGTNDLHNLAVKNRQHATHLLIRRSYIEEFGGTFDGTGIVFSEQYDHQYCDNELVALAKLRRQWGFADNSIVEHLHPAWKLAEWDDTYHKSYRRWQDDRKLFLRRVRTMRAYRGSRHRRTQK